MKSHICEVLDNEYRTLVSEIHSKSGNLSDISKREIHSKLHLKVLEPSNVDLRH